ncbi:MAG TPA: isoprenylcysteine carboxylmethyltransferase family protein [Gillisia sp.]|nr:isoprenylcysteine carboxylmethyltransferase family protein [Gillisia sp.]
MRTKIKDIIYVGIQFLLFAIYLFEVKDLRFDLPDIFNFIMLPFIAAGILIIAISMLQLNKNLSPFPSPKENSELIITGLYKWIRHPIYSGILLLAFSFALYQNSGFKIVMSFFMLILFYFKTSYEEKQLSLKFPEYKNYKNTAGRFFSKIKF